MLTSLYSANCSVDHAFTYPSHSKTSQEEKHQVQGSLLSLILRLEQIVCLIRSFSGCETVYTCNEIKSWRTLVGVGRVLKNSKWTYIQILVENKNFLLWFENIPSKSLY